MKLWLAANQGNRALVAQLLAKRPSSAALNEAIVTACLFGYAEIAGDLLTAGADPNAASREGHTALRLAARRSLPIVKDLLGRGADPNLVPPVSRDGRTAIFDADTSAIVASLASAGADVNRHDSGGETPLITAIHQRKRSIAEALLKAGADPNLPDRNGNSPLYLALAAEIRAAQADPEAAYLPSILRQAGARPVDVRPVSLYMAVADGDEARVRHLLHDGTDPNRRIDRGETALCLAAELNLLGAALALLGAGADVNLANNAGMTPLMIAARGDSMLRRGYVEMVKLLINAGADPAIVHRDSEGDMRDAASYAREHRREDVAAILQSTPRTPSAPLPPPGLRTTDGDQLVIAAMAPIDQLEDALLRIAPGTAIVRDVFGREIELPERPWRILQYVSCPWTILSPVCGIHEELADQLLHRLVAELAVKGMLLYCVEEPRTIAWRLYEGDAPMESLSVGSDDAHPIPVTPVGVRGDGEQPWPSVRKSKGLLWMSRTVSTPPTRRSSLRFVQQRIAGLGVHIPDLRAAVALPGEVPSPGDLYRFTYPGVDPVHLVRFDLAAVRSAG